MGGFAGRSWPLGGVSRGRSGMFRGFATGSDPTQRGGVGSGPVNCAFGGVWSLRAVGFRHFELAILSLVFAAAPRFTFFPRRRALLWGLMAAG